MTQPGAWTFSGSILSGSASKAAWRMAESASKSGWLIHKAARNLRVSWRISQLADLSAWRTSEAFAAPFYQDPPAKQHGGSLFSQPGARTGRLVDPECGAESPLSESGRESIAAVRRHLMFASVTNVAEVFKAASTHVRDTPGKGRTRRVCVGQG